MMRLGGAERRGRQAATKAGATGQRRRPEQPSRASPMAVMTPVMALRDKSRTTVDRSIAVQRIPVGIDGRPAEDDGRPVDHGRSIDDRRPFDDGWRVLRRILRRIVGWRRDALSGKAVGGGPLQANGTQRNRRHSSGGNRAARLGTHGFLPSIMSSPNWGAIAI